MTEQEVYRRLGQHYRIDKLIPLVREMIEETTSPGCLPHYMQRAQLTTILTAFASYCTKYEKRIVP